MENIDETKRFVDFGIEELYELEQAQFMIEESQDSYMCCGCPSIVLETNDGSYIYVCNVTGKDLNECEDDEWCCGQKCKVLRMGNGARSYVCSVTGQCSEDCD